MEPAPTANLVRTIQSIVLVLGGAGMWWWFLGMPDFHNALEYGLHSVRSRGGGATVIFFGVPVFGAAQLALAVCLWRGWGGTWLPLVATLVTVVDALVGVGFLVLLVALRNFNMH